MLDISVGSRGKWPMEASVVLGPSFANVMCVRRRQSEAVFQVLDGHDFDFEGTHCHVEVYGVYDDGEYRWVQLALEGQQHRMVTLKIAAPREVPVCSLVSLAVAS